MSSMLMKRTIKTSKNHSVDVIVTARRISNTFNGNPRCFIQVWTDHKNNHRANNVWAPPIPYYRLNKDDGYNVEYHSMEGAMLCLIAAFEKAVYRD